MIINATIQVVPLTDIETALGMIDEVIALIQQSGISYTVGAFETTLEGEYEEVQQLLKKIEDTCYNQKELQFLLYTKLHICGSKDITVQSKTAKFYEPPVK
ncbi:MAG: thiamine-binding protein [Chitinophagales bacterium]|nr:thiamine-binding protein [Chitinophagales bacterium]